MAKLSLCMIVKNEEECLARCLRSVRDLVDEIIIVDTGSADRTKEIAASFGARLFDFAWRDDFAAARNESVRHATGDWILVLDADETIATQDHARICALIDRNEAPDGYILLQRTYQASDVVFGLVRPQNNAYEESHGYPGWVEHAIVRLFQNKGFMFSGVIHELIEHSIEEQGGRIGKSGVAIHHFGEEKDEDKKQSKQEMYHRLQEKKLQDNPHDPKALFELGMQCLQEKKLQEAQGWLEKSLAARPGRKVAIVLLHVYAMVHSDDKALKLYQSFFHEGQDVRAEFLVGKILYKSGEYNKVEKHLAPLITIGHAGAHELLAKMYLAQGRLDAAKQLLEHIVDVRPLARYNLAPSSTVQGARRKRSNTCERSSLSGLTIKRQGQHSSESNKAYK